MSLPDPTPAPLHNMRSIAGALARAGSVVVTTHITPDGDGLGSALALARYLRSRGCDAQLINCSASPDNLRFLCRPGEFQVYYRRRHLKRLQNADLIVATDIGGAMRLGRMEPVIREAPATKVVIDHHIYENDLFDLALIVPEASSSSEITCDLIRHMGGTITTELAEPLYVGLISDTGNFSYSATSPRVHRMAAGLLEAGVEPHAVWRRLSCQVTPEKMRTLGLCLANLRYEDGGRLVWTCVEQDLLRREGLPARDAFEVVNHLLTLKGVEAGAFFLEIDAGRTKVSLRSAGRVDVSELAGKHGGGGHMFAAGCTVDLGLDDAIDRVLDDLRATLAAGAGEAG